MDGRERPGCLTGKRGVFIFSVHRIFTVQIAHLARNDFERRGVKGVEAYSVFFSSVVKRKNKGFDDLFPGHQHEFRENPVRPDKLKGF